MGREQVGSIRKPCIGREPMDIVRKPWMERNQWIVSDRLAWKDNSIRLSSVHRQSIISLHFPYLTLYLHFCLSYQHILYLQAYYNYILIIFTNTWPCVIYIYLIHTILIIIGFILTPKGEIDLYRLTLLMILMVWYTDIRVSLMNVIQHFANKDSRSTTPSTWTSILLQLCHIGETGQYDVIINVMLCHLFTQNLIHTSKIAGWSHVIYLFKYVCLQSIQGWITKMNWAKCMQSKSHTFMFMSTTFVLK